MIRRVPQGFEMLPLVRKSNLAQPAVYDIPSEAERKLWHAIENHVLRNAVAERSHVRCFTGPVFDEQTDIPWRGSAFRFDSGKPWYGRSNRSFTLWR